MVVTDAVIEGPDGVELIDSVEVAVADRVDTEDGLTKGINEVLCPDTPVKVWKQMFGFLIVTFFG